jgi:hypothetical protein
MSSSNGASPIILPGDPRWPKPLGETAYHGPAGEFARIVSPQTESDPVALLTQFLCFFGNAAGRNAYVVIEGAKHHLNIFVVLVGRTAKGRKGSAERHDRNFFTRVDQAWVRGCVQGGLATGQGLTHHLRDDTTDEDGVVVPGRKDARLLAIENEWSTVLKRCAGKDAILSQNLRQAWDDGYLANMTRGEPETASNVHVSMIGHIVMDELCRHLTTTEIASGLANRNLFFCVQRSKCLPFGGDLDEGSLSTLVMQVHSAVEFVRKGGQFTFDPIAREMWAEMYPTLSRDDRQGLAGAILARTEAQARRLMNIYAGLDSTFVVSPEHLTAALELVNYSEQSVRYVFGDKLGDPDADAILGVLRAKPEGMTRTEINELFSHNISAGRMGAALAKLMELKLAHCIKLESTGGRRAERWYAITKNETEEAAQKWTV